MQSLLKIAARSGSRVSRPCSAILGHKLGEGEFSVAIAAFTANFQEAAVAGHVGEGEAGAHRFMLTQAPGSASASRADGRRFKPCLSN